ncbi:MAG: 4'-phosphopantetheinyl transferase superfamily protein [Desulfamplus sp.]|nr:4'-phosphopantetheinyl transferase superfamily protein [Desulfamplus sp.]
MPKKKFDLYLSKIPDLFREKILNLARWEDQQNSLTGKLLLKYGLEKFSNPPESIESVQLSGFGKPFIENRVCFNISHSGNCCVCAFHSSEIGIDIEAVRPIAFRDFFNLFTRQEKDIITNSETPLNSFYEIWTRKEAIIKAHGKGLSTGLETFCVSGNSSVINSIKWYIHPIAIANNYISNIALRDKYPKISIKYISW